MHRTVVVGLDKSYLRKLRIVMDPNIRKNKKRIEANIRKDITAELEIHKLETELCSRTARISPMDAFIMRKRIRALNGMLNGAAVMDAISSNNEALVIGGAHKQFN